MAERAVSFGLVCSTESNPSGCGLPEQSPDRPALKEIVMQFRIDPQKKSRAMRAARKIKLAKNKKAAKRRCLAAIKDMIGG